MKKNKQVHELAVRYKRSRRTVQRWIREGAPSDNPKALAAWISGRRVAPPAQAEAPPPKPPKPPAPPAPPPGGEPGAPAALRRLEQSELAAYHRLESALVRGSALDIRDARRGYLETVETLRKTDLSISEARRTSGETLSRGEVEGFAERAGRAIGLLGFEIAQGLAGELARLDDPGAISDLVRSAFDQRLRLALAAPAEVPPWLRRAFVKGANLGPGTEAWVEQFVTLARAYVAAHDAGILEIATRGAFESEARAKLWRDGLDALKRGDLDEVPGIALDKWNEMRAEMGLPPRPRLPTGAEIKRAAQMREKGELAGDADVPLDPA